MAIFILAQQGVFFLVSPAKFPWKARDPTEMVALQLTLEPQSFSQ